MDNANADWISDMKTPNSCSLVYVPREYMKMTAVAAEQCISMLQSLRESLPEDTALAGLRTSNIGNARKRIEAILIELWMLRADTGHVT